MGKETFRPGGLLSGQKFTLDDKNLSFKGALRGYASVPRSSIQTVTIEPKSAGTSFLKIIGNGTELAKIKLPHTWAAKTQKWLMEQLNI